MPLSYDDLIEPTIVRQVSKSVAYCRCTRRKTCRSATALTQSQTFSHSFWSSNNRKPSPSAAVGNPKIIPIATAPMAGWSNRKNVHRANHG